MASDLTVVKVGGSLYDLPDLGTRLRRWLGARGGDVLLVPGGGPTADAVRQLDGWHALGEERSHWLALQALSLNASFLAALLRSGNVVEHWRDVPRICQMGLVPVLAPWGFVQNDEAHPDHLPHTWDVTSDSVAAHAALRAGARALVLLKSVTVPPEMSWAEASQLGFVDVMFPRLVERAGPGLCVEAVNFRAWRP